MKKILLNTALLATILVGSTYTATVYASCSCPSGYNYVAGNSNAKACKKRIKHTKVRKASCDTGFVIDINGGSGNKDICKSAWGWGSPSGATVPDGTSGIFGPAENFGWRLKPNGGRDNWEKITYSSKYKFCLSS